MPTTSKNKFETLDRIHMLCMEYGNKRAALSKTLNRLKDFNKTWSEYEKEVVTDAIASVAATNRQILDRNLYIELENILMKGKNA